MPLDDALRYAAERNGVQQDFWDIFGHRHFTAPETNRAILTALGFDCASEDSLRASLAAREEAEKPAAAPGAGRERERTAADTGAEREISISKSSPNRAKHHRTSQIENGVAPIRR